MRVCVGGGGGGGGRGITSNDQDCAIPIPILTNSRIHIRDFREISSL